MSGNHQGPREVQHRCNPSWVHLDGWHVDAVLSACDKGLMGVARSLGINQVTASVAPAWGDPHMHSPRLLGVSAGTPMRHHETLANGVGVYGALQTP